MIKNRTCKDIDKLSKPKENVLTYTNISKHITVLCFSYSTIFSFTVRILTHLPLASHRSYLRGRFFWPNWAGVIQWVGGLLPLA